jgi:hypothetical protein
VCHDFWIYPPNRLSHNGPPLLLSESFRSGTHGTEHHQRVWTLRCRRGCGSSAGMAWCVVMDDEVGMRGWDMPSEMEVSSSVRAFGGGTVACIDREEYTWRC